MHRRAIRSVLFTTGSYFGKGPGKKPYFFSSVKCMFELEPGGKLQPTVKGFVRSFIVDHVQARLGSRTTQRMTVQHV